MSKTIKRRTFLKASTAAAGAFVFGTTAPYYFQRNIAKAQESDTIKVGILHSLSGTIAIIETSLHNAELLAIEEINAKGGVLGKKTRAGGRGPAVAGAGLCRKSQEAAARRQGGRGARLLHVREPSIGAAGVRGVQRPAALSDALRGPGVQQELLLHGRRAQSAARRFRAVDHQDPRPQEVLHDRLQLHLSQGDQSRSQGAAGEARRRRMSARSTRRSATPNFRRSSTISPAAARTSYSPTSSAIRSSPSTSSSSSSV